MGQSFEIGRGARQRKKLTNEAVNPLIMKYGGSWRSRYAVNTLKIRKLLNLCRQRTDKKELTAPQRIGGFGEGPGHPTT